MKHYDQKLSQIICRRLQEIKSSLILVKVYFISAVLLRKHFIMDAPLAIFANFPEFLLVRFGVESLRTVYFHSDIPCVLSLLYI